MNISDIKSIKIASIKWVKNNPDEALWCLLAGGLAVAVLTVFSFYFATRVHHSAAPDPIAAPKNWVFVERIPAGGGQVCDLYKRGEISQARCYGKDSSGKWVLKGTF